MRFFQGAERAGRELFSALLSRTLNVKKISLADLRATFDDGEIRKILLVRNYQGMGDLLCASPVIPALKIRFPKASIHFFANTFNSAVLKDNPNIDKVWAWNEHRKADPRQWITLRKALTREHFDLALVLSGNALSLTAMLWAALSEARWVVGEETMAYGKPWGRQLYSYEVPHQPTTHEADRYMALLKGLGISCPTRSPEFYIRADHQAVAERFWKEHFELVKEPVLGIFLGGKVDRPDRIWPPANYARVARQMADTSGCKLLVIAPPLPAKKSLHERQSTFWMDEAVHEREFRDAHGGDFPIFRHADLGCVGAVLQKLDLLLCPDGGIMHVAAALKVPTLTLFFGTNPELWHPRVPTSFFLRGPQDNPSGLTPDVVAKKALDLLASL